MNILESCIFIPDTKIGWIPFAFIKGFTIVLKEKPDIIFTSSPPHSLQLTGFLLKNIFKCKWVVDFRDPWQYRFVNSSKAVKVINNIFEKIVIKNADFIIANTNGMEKELLNKYAFLLPSKIKVITNGFDSIDNENFKLVIKNNVSKYNSSPLKIVFIGTVYRGMIDSFARALKELKNENKKLHEQIKIVFFGLICESGLEVIKELQLGDLIEYRGFISQDKVFFEMFNADILLLLLSESKRDHSCIPSKTFNYIITGKPIFAIIPEGDAKEVLEKTNTGIFANPADVNNIKITLKKIIQDFSIGRLRIDPCLDEINKYDRKNLTMNLIEMFEN